MSISTLVDTRNSSSNAWVTFPRPNPNALLRLFCFPYAGGGTAVFHTWPYELGQGVEVCPIQLPGRESRLREAPFTSMDSFLDSLVPSIQPHLDKPFAIFGHSMGATISFELAHRLRSQDQHPVCLFISGRRAPQIPNSGSPMHHLPDDIFMQRIMQFKGTPEIVLQNTELLELCLPVLRADITLLETYSHNTNRRPLECPICAFGGVEDEEVGRNELDAWREQTQGPFTLQMFSGDHFFLRSAHSQLTRAISQALAESLALVVRGTG